VRSGALGAVFEALVALINRGKSLGVVGQILGLVFFALRCANFASQILAQGVGAVGLDGAGEVVLVFGSVVVLETHV